ncbi:DivIVA domain-containing protein [Leucobacter denitrificans]|uniref:DivIVA domain-containing protein n=2 Tax=Leucobacter denitrificans TaxID=683042 RepID=A0A7G9S7H3_9MICO|nr:DivIVA domain-containing protein [Leucobacter denitrificans]
MNSPFPMTKGREKGYQPKQVDEFLDRARSAYEDNEAPPLTAADVRNLAFKLQRHGYVPRYVDAALDRLEDVFFERERRAQMREVGEDAWWQATRGLLSEVRGRIDRPRGKRFRRRGWFARGYRRSQVDAFLDRIGEMFRNREVSVTSSEVREVVFHPQWRGYDEAQVDALLDSLVDIILSTR